MTKQQIPEISGVQDSKAAIILRGMKSIIEEMTGRSKVAIQYLDGATSSSGIINKINEVIARLQGDTINFNNTASSTLIIGGTSSSVSAGNIGEEITSVIDFASPSSVITVSGTQVNLTSILLAAGNWDVSGASRFVNGGTTSLTVAQASISTTSATHNSNFTAYTGTFPAAITGTLPILNIAPQRISLTSTTTVYLVVSASYTSTNPTNSGIIRARRI